MKLLRWFANAFIETLNQLWTLLGMFVAWCVLDGSAKTVVGFAILFTLVMWLITIGLRDRE
jgi:hypothetical protein